MSFLDVPGVKAGALDTSIEAKINDTGSAIRGALNATYAPATGSPNYTSPTQAAGLSAALSIVFGG